jgi:hypothetical protein
LPEIYLSLIERRRLVKIENEMLYLCCCAVNNIKPEPLRIENIDLDELFEICQSHKLTALVCYALEMVITPDKKWGEAKGKSIRKNMLLDLERRKILAFMEQNGIKNMPLKGVYIKEYYPKAGMRQMSDNDIYFDGTHREIIEKYMRSIGYEDIEKGLNHDEYKRPPVYNFEMHFSLFADYDSKVLSEYYSDIDKRLLKDENNNFGYHLSNEDFYIYIIAHEYKHFINCGTGLRSLLDCLVLLKKFEDTLDWNYIKQETDKLGMTDFEQTQRKLCKKLFTKKLTKAEKKMLEYFSSCGAYGNTKTGEINTIKKIIKSNRSEEENVTLKMKFSYVFSRLFPPLEAYKTRYPFFYRHKYLIPFLFVYRMVNGLIKIVFKKDKAIKTEIEALK